MREKIGRCAAAGTTRHARGKDGALGIDDMCRRDADPAGLMQEVLDDALAVGVAADEPGDGVGQVGVGCQPRGFVAPLGNPLLQCLDLGVEQGLQAGGADLAQRIADAAIGPGADGEERGQQQEQGNARPVERDFHMHSLSATKTLRTARPAGFAFSGRADIRYHTAVAMRLPRDAKAAAPSSAAVVG